VAVGQVKIDGSATSTGFNAGLIPGAATCTGPTAFGSSCPLAAWNSSDTKTGFALGGGVEGLIGKNWSLKAEYLYVDLGSVHNGFATLPGCYGTPSEIIVGPVHNGGGCLNVAAGTGNIRSRITDNIVRLGLNYRFAGP
jgi:outer membrane immunogenic protein